MNKFAFTLTRAAIALLIGVLLAFNPEQATKIIVIIIGVSFLLLGIVTLFSYFKGSNDRSDVDIPVRNQLPFTSIGCILFGLTLSLMPEIFMVVSMYILGGFLILAGAYQIVCFRLDSKIVSTPAIFYVISVLIMIAGVSIFITPIDWASLPMLIIGISFIVYAVMEIALCVKRGIVNHRIKKAAEAAENVKIEADSGNEGNTTDSTEEPVESPRDSDKKDDNLDRINFE